MKFLFPQALWGLLAIAIPIIVHLFSFRRSKIVYFSSVRFLREIKEEVNSKSKLRHLLTLLARCLAIFFLVMAFAQPYFPDKNSSASPDKGNVYAIYVDNSLSMMGQSANASLLDDALAAAKNIAKSANLNDRFLLLDNDFKGSSQRTLSAEDFINALDEIKPTPATKNLSNIYERQFAELQNIGDKTGKIVLISDFQKATLQLENFKPDTSFQTLLFKLQPPVSGNISIDSCWFLNPVVQPGETNQLLVRIRNFAENPYDNLRVELQLNGKLKGVANVDLGGNSIVVDTLSFMQDQAGWNEAVVSITDFPIAFDDKYFLTYFASESIPVLVLVDDNNSNYAADFFKSQPFFKTEVQQKDAIDFGRLNQFKTVVLAGLPELSSGLEDALTRFLASGGTVLVIPSSKMSPNYKLDQLSFGTLNQSGFEFSEINLQDKLFAGVFRSVPKNMEMPTASAIYPINGGATLDWLIRSPGRANLFARVRSGAGFIYASAVPFDNSMGNFHRHSLMVPTLYQMVLYSAGEIMHAGILGEPTDFQFPDLDITNKEQNILLENGTYKYIPVFRKSNGVTTLQIGAEIEKEGIYKLSGNQDLRIAMNISRLESDPTTYNNEEIEAWKSDKNVQLINLKDSVQAGSILAKAQTNTNWKWFLGLVLLFLLFEILLINRNR